MSEGRAILNRVYFVVGIALIATGVNPATSVLGGGIIAGLGAGLISLALSNLEAKHDH